MKQAWNRMGRLVLLCMVCCPALWAGAIAVVRDAGKDHPGLHFSAVRSKAEAVPIAQEIPPPGKGRYLVIDLSGGADAAGYPHASRRQGLISPMADAAPRSCGSGRFPPGPS